MILATAKLKSLSTYGQSQYWKKEKLKNETEDACEERCWRQRMHVNADGYVYIPPMAFKNALASAAKYLNIKIPGGGHATYTKHFRSGVQVVDSLVLPIKADDVKPTSLFVPSNGRSGGGARVKKLFPTISSWQGSVTYHIFDTKIDQKIFREVLEASGQFIGVGMFRPENGGYWGIFEVKSLSWK